MSLKAIKYFNQVGEWPLVLSFLIVGLACQASVGFVVFLLDDDTLSAKTCSHHTEEDITIWLNYKVLILYLLLKLG